MKEIAVLNKKDTKLFRDSENDMTMMSTKGHRGNFGGTDFGFLGTAGSAESRVATMRNNGFLAARRAGKKIIAQIDGTTKDGFLNIIVGNRTHLVSSEKGAEVIHIIHEDKRERFF